MWMSLGVLKVLQLLKDWLRNRFETTVWFDHFKSITLNLYYTNQVINCIKRNWSGDNQYVVPHDPWSGWSFFFYFSDTDIVSLCTNEIRSMKWPHNKPIHTKTILDDHGYVTRGTFLRSSSGFFISSVTIASHWIFLFYYVNTNKTIQTSFGN